MRAAVVDDEPVARQGLLRLLREQPDVEVVGDAADGEEALTLLRRQRPDVVFLDIRMPGLDGIALAEALRRMESPPAVVFVTAHDEHAARAFELDAIDYLLKPFDRQRLASALERVERRLRRKTAETLERTTRALFGLLGEDDAAGASSVGRLVIRDGGTVVFLQPDEVIRIESAGNYVRIHTDAETWLIRDTLQAMEERLDSAGFLRISRSALVNLDEVREVRRRPNGTHEVVLRDGTHLSASRRRGDDLRAAIARLK